MNNEMNMKIKMTWRGFSTLCLMCAVAVGCMAADKKLAPAKEVEPAPKLTNGIAPVTSVETNTLLVACEPYQRVVWPESKVIISRPTWLLATNWLTTAYLLPADRSVLKPGENIVTVVQRASVTSNLVMVVSWTQTGATNQMTNAFVLQSILVPEWSNEERWAQEMVATGR